MHRNAIMVLNLVSFSLSQITRQRKGLPDHLRSLNILSPGIIKWVRQEAHRRVSQESYLSIYQYYGFIFGVRNPIIYIK